MISIVIIGDLGKHSSENRGNSDKWCFCKVACTNYFRNSFLLWQRQVLRKLPVAVKMKLTVKMKTKLSLAVKTRTEPTKMITAILTKTTFPVSKLSFHGANIDDARLSTCFNKYSSYKNHNLRNFTSKIFSFILSMHR
jgi:hypothetical protein